MKLIRSLVIASATGLALAAFAGPADANDWWRLRSRGCNDCGHGWGHGHGHAAAPNPSTLFSGLGHKNLPVFQAAPWYNYWPYDGHFLTPAPVSGPFYGPPLTGNFPVNPYFPGPAGAAGFGPIPGGPPPHMAHPGLPGMPPAPGGHVLPPR